MRHSNRVAEVATQKKDVINNASSAMLQTLKTSKRTQVAADIQVLDIDNGLSCSSHNCYFRK